MAFAASNSKYAAQCVQSLRRRFASMTSAVLGSRFAEDDRGNIAIVFALTTFVVVSMVGGAVDFGRAYSTKAKMQQALDAAVLAAASAYQNDPAHDVTAATQHGTKFFNAIMADVPGASMTSTLNTESKTVTMTSTVPIKTPFLSLVGIDGFTMLSYSEATATEGVVGGGSDSDVEVALMLDTTGSMSSLSGGSGTPTKIAALKTAATNFIDILIPDSGSLHAKIGLAPFAPTVKVSDAIAQAATGHGLTQSVCTQTQNVCVNTTCAVYRSNGSCRTWNQSCSQQCTQTSTQYLSRCMLDRTGAAATTDAAPAAGTYLPATWKSSLSSATSCTPSQALVPLSQDKAALKNTINGFTSNGSTAGALGTAWAHYLLSPSWNSALGNSARAYNTPKLKKIAVLMTDGTYNTTGNVAYADGGTQAVEISNRAVDICADMKRKGIEVYTVGFKLDTQLARDTLNHCATDSTHAFLAEDEAQLEAAFREVAFRAVPLHLAK